MNYHIEIKTLYIQHWRRIASFVYEVDRNTCLNYLEDIYKKIDCEVRPNDGVINE